MPRFQVKGTLASDKWQSHTHVAGLIFGGVGGVYDNTFATANHHTRTSALPRNIVNATMLNKVQNAV